MSGIIPGDDIAQRYHQRFNELINMNHNRSVAPSSVGSLCESTIGGRSAYNNRQNGNAALSTNQFYNITHQDQFRAENCVSNQPQIDGSSYAGASDTSVFKKPLPVKSIKSFKPHIKRRLDLMVEALSTIEDKQALKFSMTTIETIVHSLKNPPFAPPVNPVLLIDYIANLVKQEYYAKRVPKSICSSSVTSEQTIDDFTDPRVVLQDITQTSLARGQCNINRTAQRFNHSTVSGAAAPSHRQEQTMSMSSTTLLDKLNDGTLSSVNFLNDSEIARRRDEAAVSQDRLATVVPRARRAPPRATPKPKPPPTASRRPSSKSCNSSQEDKNISVLNGTSTGVSRRGRLLKPPVKYWNSKGEEISDVEPEQSILDESMTLRNKKVVEKKKTPPSRGRKSTSPKLAVIKENAVLKPPAAVNTKGRKKPEKENVVANESGNKSSSASVKKNTSLKENTNKKRDTTIKSKEKVVKEPATKRKSKDKNTTVTKKKKVEDPVLSEEEDNIFGDVIYKKPAHQNFKLALSPTAALLSAKKAAGQAEGKATPPCKAIGDLLGNESVVSVMSASKDAPKPNEAVKRIIKKMENQQSKPTQTKAKQVEKKKKDDSHIAGAAKPLYVGANPFGDALSVFRANEEDDEDLSDIDLEDDDDDLM